MMTCRKAAFIALALCLLSHAAVPLAAQSEAAAASREAGRFAVVAVPDAQRERLKLAPFYRQYVDVHGFAVVASDKPSPHALLEAAHLIDRMLSRRRDVLEALARNKVRFTVMGVNELTTDVPEHSDLIPKDYWDRRARGLGPTSIRPTVSCGEENLLCLPGDPYSKENILIHEFAHAVDLMGLRSLDPTFERRLDETYQAAMKEELWKGKYAARNKEEYWAEGVQSYFDTNRPPDHDHNHVGTRGELVRYDPRLAELIKGALGDTEWRYVRADARPTAEHLAGFRRAEAPTFAWPQRLQKPQ